ncbi:MAG TPA: DHA2 family efflux MFS transporter permease subunit [Candidatus Eisenbergiella merdipullorum]|uniref:DHA2 family efflux MFS transporter permease subunit n=1 Tax=Candidatus Eisenbergiella merdipullorum TaxID=2838553 RepID=A0A9D2I6G1_9FIRM|nr:DHA2 family efflux MFS transporter permease subunit [Candidatus Eisenbergiella merdipullorum]
MKDKHTVRLTDRKRSLIFICLVVSGIASSTLSTAMTTALPNVVEYFGISTSVGQWITSGYSLAMGMVMPLTAFLITRFPTKRLYLTGIGGFIIGLLLSIFAGNFAVMMVGRILQACGNGILMAAAQVVILTVYPVEKKGTMMGTYGLATTAAPIIAPTIAGLMIDTFGWKSIFWLVLVIMCLSFVLSGFVFEDVLELQDKKFDVLSFLESIFAFGGITLGIGNISEFGLVSVQAGLPLLIGAVVCVFFVLRQCGLEKPFLDVKILRNRNYAVSVVASMILYLVMMGSSVMMPLYVQSVMGYSAVVSGLVTLPGSLATAVISPFAGRLYDKMGIKRIFVAGSAALVVSNIGMFFLSMSAPLWVAAVLNVIRNIAIGSLMMPLLTWGTSNVEEKKVADASSLLTSFRTIAGSIGSAVFVGIMNAVSASSAAAYGDQAQMHGMNVAFLGMSAGAVLLMLISIFAVRKAKR